MTRLLGLLVAALLTTAACGSGSGSARDPENKSSGPGTVPTEDFSYDVVALVSGSAAHGPGVKGTRPVLISDEASLERFADRFEGPLPSSLEQQGRQALRDLAQGDALTATVVAVGCEPPTEVTVRYDGGVVAVEAVPVTSNIQCLVPVTTVALVSVPEEFAPGFAQPLGGE